MTTTLDSIYNFSFNDFIKYIPLATPAVSEDGFEIDDELLQKRVYVLASAVFVTLAAAFLTAETALTFSLISLISTATCTLLANSDLGIENDEHLLKRVYIIAVVVLAAFAIAFFTAQTASTVLFTSLLAAATCLLPAGADLGYAMMTAEGNTFSNFIDEEHPSIKAIEMFQKEPAQAEALIKAYKNRENKIDLLKTSSNGSDLLFSFSGPDGEEKITIPCLESLKALVKGGLNLKKEATFISLLSSLYSRSEEYYDYLVKEKPVDASDFTEEEQARILEQIEPFNPNDPRFWFLYDLNFKVPIKEEPEEY